MAAPTSTTTLEVYEIDANTVYLQSYQVRHDSAWTYLTNYTYPGGSSMPDFNWAAPSGNIFELKLGAGQFQMDSTTFSSLSPNQRRIFFRYLTKFVFECLKNYNQSYNL